jgi:hypothetical protein
MSEVAERISTAAHPDAPADTAATETAISPGSPASSSPEHWKLLALAALGATFGFLTGLGLWNQIYFHSVEFALVVIPLALAAYVLFDPLLDLLHGQHGEHTHKKKTASPERRGLVAFAVGTLATIVVSGFDHSLDIALDIEKLSQYLQKETLPEALAYYLKPLQALASDLSRLEKVGGFAIAMIVFLLIGGASVAVTYFWMRGARRQPPRAAHWGALAGLGAGVVAAAIIASYLQFRHLLGVAPSWILASVVLLWFFVPGLMGGLALHRQRPDASATFGILGYLIFSSAILAVLLLVLAGAIFPEHAELVWLPIAALGFQNLGWAAGPFFRREFCDDHLRTPSKPVKRPSGAPKTGNLVAMPLREGALAVAAVVPEDTRPPAARAQEMLLKPKGDRLWATVALLLALVSSALAYRLGTLRSDPDIDNNVAKLFHEDSGLDTRGLQITSAHRVVTLSGVVENEAEHAKAVQEALAVRGVKQLIDQIQVLPAAPVSAGAPSTASGVSAQTPAAINATISVGASTGAGSTAGKGQAGNAQKPAAASKADSQKHGFFHLPKRNNQTSTTGAQKQADPSKTADSQKQGFFHFLKKNKDKNDDKTKTDKNKKDPTRNDPGH